MVTDKQEINSQKVMFTHAGSKTFVCSHSFQVAVPHARVVYNWPANIKPFGSVWSEHNLKAETCIQKETESHLNEKITMTVDKHLST